MSKTRSLPNPQRLSSSSSNDTVLHRSKPRRLRATAAKAVAIVALASCGLGPLAGQAHALECGNHIVVLGDTMSAVTARCGAPTRTRSRVESRTVWVMAPGPGFAGQSHTVTVQVETWTYDFGPGRFLEELEFHDGVLVASRPMARPS